MKEKPRNDYGPSRRYMGGCIARTGSDQGATDEAGIAPLLRRVAASGAEGGLGAEVDRLQWAPLQQGGL